MTVDHLNLKNTFHRKRARQIKRDWRHKDNLFGSREDHTNRVLVTEHCSPTVLGRTATSQPFQCSIFPRAQVSEESSARGAAAGLRRPGRRRHRRRRGAGAAGVATQVGRLVDRPAAAGTGARRRAAVGGAHQTMHHAASRHELDPRRAQRRPAHRPRRRRRRTVEGAPVDKRSVAHLTISTPTESTETLIKPSNLGYNKTILSNMSTLWSCNGP